MGNTPNECPGYDTKQSDGEALVMLEICGMRSTPSLLSLPGPLWPRMVAPYRVQSMGPIKLNGELFKIELFWHLNCVLMVNWIVWNETVYMYKNGFSIK